MSYQTTRMPEQIRLKIGGPTNAQFSVYDEIAKNIPGFQPLTERDAALVIPKVNLPVSNSSIEIGFSQVYCRPLLKTATGFKIQI